MSFFHGGLRRVDGVFDGVVRSVVAGIVWCYHGSSVVIVMGEGRAQEDQPQDSSFVIRKHI